MRTGRRRVAATLAVVLGMALLAGLVTAGARRPSSLAGPVYTVAQVRAGLARQPAAWAGRTLLVRGVAVESFWATGPATSAGHLCYLPSFTCPLVAPNGTTVYLAVIDDSVRPNPRHAFFMVQNTTTLFLAVQPITPNPLIAFARRLPPLTRFLSAQEQVLGGVSHLYRIRLWSATSIPRCASFPFTCGTGVLVNA